MKLNDLKIKQFSACTFVFFLSLIKWFLNFSCLIQSRVQQPVKSSRVESLWLILSIIDGAHHPTIISFIDRAINKTVSVSSRWHLGKENRTTHHHVSLAVEIRWIERRLVSSGKYGIVYVSCSDRKVYTASWWTLFYTFIVNCIVIIST